MHLHVASVTEEVDLKLDIISVHWNSCMGLTRRCLCASPCSVLISTATLCQEQQNSSWYYWRGQEKFTKTSSRAQSILTWRRKSTIMWEHNFIKIGFWFIKEQLLFLVYSHGYLFHTGFPSEMLKYKLWTQGAQWINNKHLFQKSSCL